MAAAVPDEGFGHSITFQTSYFTGWLRVTNWNNISREAIETTHSGSTGGKRTYMPSDLEDPGELQCDIMWRVDTKPPIDSAAETITLTFPVSTGNTTGATWAASGFLTNFSGACPYNGMMTATCTLKFTGDITVTAGS